ncbi:hypothetical protein G6F35_014756 [Rhizopus arrhizus]|nr:hypothetical protein G6F35_014756 [Rhizopus arrhizus]
MPLSAVRCVPEALRPRDRAAGKGHRRPTAGQLHRCRGRAGTAQGRKPPGTGRRRVAGQCAGRWPAPGADPHAGQQRPADLHLRAGAVLDAGAGRQRLLGSRHGPGRETPMQARRMRTTAVVAVILAMAPLAGIRAESLQADDRAYFADAAAEQRARDALEKQLEALQHAAGIAPAQRFQQAEAMQAQCLRHHAYLHLQAARNARDHRPAQALDQVMGLCSRIARTARAALREAPMDAAWAAPR